MGQLIITEMPERLQFIDEFAVKNGKDFSR
jgi:hypothetical protein